MNPSVTSPIINTLINAGADLDYITTDKKYSLLIIYLKYCKTDQADL